MPDSLLDGFCLGNKIAELHRNALRMLEKKFNAVFTCNLFTGNLIVLASKTALEPLSPALKSRASSLEKRLGFSILNHYLRLMPFRDGTHLRISEGSPFM